MIAAQLALLLPLLGSSPTLAQQATVEPAVREAIAASPAHEAYVLVAFTASDTPIAVKRNEILASLPESEFRPIYQWQHVAGMTGYASERGLELLSQHRFVEVIGSDMEGSGQLGTSVPFIGATQAHSNGITGDGVTIAVIDSGIDSDHPDLVGDIAAGGRHFLLQGADVGTDFEDQFGHGTAVSGTITSGGVVAGMGVAPDAKILPIRVISASGQSFLSDWVAAIDYVIGAAASQPELSAINMSLASNLAFTEAPCDSTAAVNVLLGQAIRTARNLGIPTFASSGNAGECNAMASPACLASAIAVAAVYESDLGREPIVATYENFFGGSFGACFDATTQADQIACFSNRSGSNEFAAPGRNIATCTLGGGTGEWTGTSQASPHIAGAFALLLEATGHGAENLLTSMKLSGAATFDACGMNPAPIRVDVTATLAAAKPFDSYCFGNGGDNMGCTNCPCGNNAASDKRGGCTNSAGSSGRLNARGLPRLSRDTLSFTAKSLPPSSATLLISGSARLPANPANPCFALASGIPTIGDGLRCTGQALKRHGLRIATSEGSIGLTSDGWGGEDAPAIGLIAQGGFASGQTRHFQGFYRDLPHGMCNSGLTSTQAVSLSFAP